MKLTVTVDGQTATVEPDTAALSWAERCSGQTYQAMGEASLQLACAYYYVQHSQGPLPVDWDQIHRWAAAHRVITAVA
jgi:hypothetical protein